MNFKYCNKCNNKVLSTLRMCPACGNKDFCNMPPSFSVNRPQQESSFSNTGTNSNNSNLSSSLASKIPYPINLTPAPLGIRFIAYILDVVILSILSAIPVSVGYILTLPLNNQGSSFLMAIAILTAYIIPFVYYTILPASDMQATYGKRTMGLKIKTIHGERLTKIQSFVRVLLMMVIPIMGILAITLTFGGMAVGYKENLAPSLGIAWLIALMLILFGPYLTALFNPSKQTLFDMIVKTIVVKG